MKTSNTDDRPTNVYELCEQVAEAIELAPKNYYQRNWACDATTVFGNEACGTAYCRAGWMYAIGKQDTRHRADLISEYGHKVLRAVGVTESDINHLFGGSSCWVDRPGSKRYVTEGAAGMRRLMTKYEESMKATKLDEKGNVVK